MACDLAQVSVIVPAYRAGKTIARALDSVAAQTLKPREILVVDDGSDDDTYEAAEAYRERLAPIELKLFRQENKGAGAARNTALMEATQSFVAFLDADDEWLPNKIERSLKYMKEGNYVLVAHNGLIVDHGRETINNCAARFREGPDPYVSLYRKGFLDTCTVVARRYDVLKAGGFDESLRNGQDFEMWLAMLKHADARFLVFDEVLSRYHVTPGSIMSNTECRLSCCIEIAVRYAPLLKLRHGRPLTSLWFRTLALHHEAAQVYRAGRNWKGLARIWCTLPITFVAVTFAYFQKPHAVRTNFVTDGGVTSTRP